MNKQTLSMIAPILAAILLIALMSAIVVSTLSKDRYVYIVQLAEAPLYDTDKIFPENVVLQYTYKLHNNTRWKIIDVKACVTDDEIDKAWERHNQSQIEWQELEKNNKE